MNHRSLEGGYFTHRAKQLVIVFALTGKVGKVDGILAGIEKHVSIFEEALLRIRLCHELRVLRQRTVSKRKDFVCLLLQV